MENDLDSILTPVLMVNWVKIWVFEPKGSPYIGLSPLLKIILEKSCLVQNVVCGCIILSNGSNWEVICIIPIFEVIFCQNLGI